MCHSVVTVGGGPYLLGPERSDGGPPPPDDVVQVLKLSWVETWCCHIPWRLLVISSGVDEVGGAVICVSTTVDCVGIQRNCSAGVE